MNLRKTIIINRAVPGSGKTTISKCILEYLSYMNISAELHSTDDYFMTADGRYEFRAEKLYSFHQLNLGRFIKSLELGVDIAICDNINLSPWQTNPYTKVAREKGYQVLCITFAPRDLEKHVMSQQVTPEKPDAHGVPEEILIRFIKEYHLYTPLLCKTFPVNPSIHRDYCWDEGKQQKIDSGKPSTHFDVDKVIEILPDQYHDMKKRIGTLVGCFIVK